VVKLPRRLQWKASDGRDLWYTLAALQVHTQRDRGGNVSRHYTALVLRGGKDGRDFVFFDDGEPSPMVELDRDEGVTPELRGTKIEGASLFVSGLGFSQTYQIPTSAIKHYIRTS
jgi:hypothetical protein